MSIGVYRLSLKCAADLDGIADYLIVRNEDAARRVVAALFEAIAAIAENPNLGERRDDLVPGLRVFSPSPPAQSYVVCYYVEATTVLISDVIHAARDWANLIARDRG